MKTITITFIPAQEQRYKTVGDWQLEPNGDLAIKITALGNPDHSFCVAVHELIEAWLCGRRGITPEMVDADDKKGHEEPYDERGEMPGCVYHREHDFALQIESLLAHEMGIDFVVYEEVLEEASDAAPDWKV